MDQIIFDQDPNIQTQNMYSPMSPLTTHSLITTHNMSFVFIIIGMFTLVFYFSYTGYLSFANSNTDVQEEQVKNMRIGSIVSYITAAIILLCGFSIIICCML